MKREFAVRSGILKGLGNTIAVATDESTGALAGNVFSTSTFNPTVSQTFYVVAQGNASDSVTKQNFKITVMKNKS